MNKTEERVLEWVNRERTKSNDPLLRGLISGIPGDPHCCTLTRSLGCFAVSPAAADNPNAGRWFPFQSGLAQPLPAYVSKFGRAFDAGRYPHLIQ